MTLKPLPLAVLTGFSTVSGVSLMLIFLSPGLPTGLYDPVIFGALGGKFISRVP